MGTLVRTAHALGWMNIIFLEGCADPWNEKVIRASCGSVFGPLTLHHCTADRFVELVTQQLRLGLDKHVLLADAKAPPASSEMSQASHVTLVLGNEGRGLNTQIRHLQTEFAHSDSVQSVSIPISGVESLNVAVAGGILMEKLRAI